MRNLKFLCLAVIAILTSCQQESQLVNSNEKKTKENIVSAETAKNVAFFYLHKNKNVPNTRNRLAEDVKVESTFSINDEKAEPIMHVINYEGGGFAVISGDNRIEPMLAYADEGTFSDDEYDYPSSLKVWIEHIKSTIDYIRTNNVAAPIELTNYWNTCEYLGKSRVIYPETFDCEEGEMMDHYLIGPLLTTTWHQGSPFNLNMPVVLSDNGTSLHAPVGCGPLAIAQILNYWKYPTIYNWNNMPNDTANNDTRIMIDAIHDYYQQNDRLLEYKYNETITTADLLDDVIKSKFGYKSAVMISYDASTVRDEIKNNNRPVIFAGKSSTTNQGHGWVCDGVHSWLSCVVQMDGNVGANYYCFFHMNWGYKEGRYNGWYNCTNFSFINTNNEEVKYDTNLKIVYKIIPF